LEELKRPSDIDLAFFSGFFDGEGCVYLHRKLRGERQPSYKLQIQVGSTYFPILEWIQRTWGFGRITKENYEKRTNRKPAWFWVVHGDKALFVLEAIFPHLAIKRADAQVGISFQRWKLRESAIHGQTTARSELSLSKEQQAKELLATSRGVEVSSIKDKIADVLGEDHRLFVEGIKDKETSRDIDIAYFAGLYDAEGCVVLKRKLMKSLSFSYGLMVEMSGTFFPVAEKVRELWGFGSVVTEGIDADKRPNRKPCWRWLTYNRDALFVLETIYPYLIVKKSDAEIGITFQHWKSKESSIWGKRNRPEASYAKEQKVKDLLAVSRSGDLSVVQKQIADILQSKEEQKTLSLN